MLLELYPRVHRRYTSLAVIGPILDGYGTWLLKQGYSTERVREHFCAARRLVPRLQQRGVGALTSLTRARLRACAPADSQEDPNLAVLVRQLDRYCESELVLYPAPALTRIEQRVAAYRTYLQQVRGFAPSTAVDPDAPRPHDERVSGPHRLRDPPDAARYARTPGSRRLRACRRPPAVACVSPARGGSPPSLPPVLGLCRRDPDRARHADRHAPRVSRREAPPGAALGHGSGAPRDDRPYESAGTPRLPAREISKAMRGYAEFRIALETSVLRPPVRRVTSAGAGLSRRCGATHAALHRAEQTDVPGTSALDTEIRTGPALRGRRAVQVQLSTGLGQRGLHGLIPCRACTSATPCPGGRAEVVEPRGHEGQRHLAAN